MKSLFPYLSKASLALRVDETVAPHAAAALAARLGIPLLNNEAENSTFLLHWRRQGLELRKSGDKNLPGALRVDFCEPAMQRRIGRCRQELVVQAAKVKPMAGTLLFDTTAGLGKDGFLLAAAGFQVWMFERHPVIAALLRDGLARAALNPLTAPVAARISLFENDALAALTQPEMLPTVIYLDPMFPQRAKSAKVKQNAQLLQHLDTADAAQEDLLLAASLALRPKKVVIKRPIQGGYSSFTTPFYLVKGKSIRYEVYAPGGRTG